MNQQDKLSQQIFTSECPQQSSLSKGDQQKNQILNVQIQQENQQFLVQNQDNQFINLDSSRLTKEENIQNFEIKNSISNVKKKINKAKGKPRGKANQKLPQFQELAHQINPSRQISAAKIVPFIDRKLYPNTRLKQNNPMTKKLELKNQVTTNAYLRCQQSMNWMGKYLVVTTCKKNIFLMNEQLQLQRTIQFISNSACTHHNRFNLAVSSYLNSQINLINTQRDIKLIYQGKNHIQNLCYIDNMLVSGDKLGVIQVWDEKHSSAVMRLAGHQSIIQDIVQINANQFASCSQKKLVWGDATKSKLIIHDLRQQKNIKEKTLKVKIDHLQFEALTFNPIYQSIGFLTDLGYFGTYEIKQDELTCTRYTKTKQISNRTINIFESYYIFPENGLIQFYDQGRKLMHTQKQKIDNKYFQSLKIQNDQFLFGSIQGEIFEYQQKDY